MEHIIKPLNSDLFTKWGFKFDGYYWTREYCPFKLCASNKDGVYMVILDQAKPGQTPPPISNNGQLLQLLAQVSGLYIHEHMKDQTFFNAKAQGEYMAKLMSDYFQFDQNLKFRLSPAPGGLGLEPDNEYTATLMSGNESTFKVKWSDGTEELLYYHCTVVSYSFLRDLKGMAPEMVWVISSEGEETPFFGCGLPRLVDPSQIKQ